MARRMNLKVRDGRAGSLGRIRKAASGIGLMQALEGRVLLAADPATWMISTNLGSTPVDDVIEVAQSPSDPTMLQATVGGKVVSTRLAADVRRIIVDAGAGDDKVTVNVGRRMIVSIRGGDGNDTLIGGAQRDLLFGGRGDDALDGRGGADMIRGGQGADILSAGQDHARDVVYRRKEDMFRLNRFDRSRKDVLSKPADTGTNGPGPIFYSDDDGGSAQDPANGKNQPVTENPATLGQWLARANAPFDGSVVAGQNLFAWDLYSRLAEQNAGKNLFFSPYSISSALAMCWAGAKGQTADEMRATLRLPSDRQKLLDEFAALDAGINGTGGTLRNYELAVANALWGQLGYEYLPEYLATLQNNFGAGLTPLDYFNDPEGSRQTINQWVEGKTHDRIQNLLPQGSVTKGTRSVLTNAIYFKGDWASPFAKESTWEGDFHISRDVVKRVPMMHQTTYLHYYEESNFQLVELPYKGGELSMVVILPKEGGTVQDMAAFEQSIPAEAVTKCVAAAKCANVAVTLPKFKMTLGYDLVPVLKTMGMTLPFGGDTDFSGMTGQKGLSISGVVHKAFVEVDEKGTEAAAATAIGIFATNSAYHPTPPPPIPFVADHPFVFMIRDNATGATLFSGRVADPSA